VETFHEFAHIDPLSERVPQVDDLFAFFDVQTQASMAFKYKRGDSDAKARASKKLTQTLDEVKRCLAERDRELRAEMDWYEPLKECDAGRHLIDWLQERDDEGKVFTKRLKSGDTICDAELISALTLVQIPRNRCNTGEPGARCRSF
jgi:hypothetical protein